MAKAFEYQGKAYRWLAVTVEQISLMTEEGEQFASVYERNAEKYRLPKTTFHALLHATDERYDGFESEAVAISLCEEAFSNLGATPKQ